MPQLRHDKHDTLTTTSGPLPKWTGLHFWSATLILHLVGRSALLFPSPSLLLHLVDRSAGRQAGPSLLIWLPSFRSGRQVGRSALLICHPYSTAGRQVGKPELIFSSHYLLLDLVGRSAGRLFSSARLIRPVGIFQSSSTLGRAEALVRWLKLPAWKVGDRGFEPHPSKHEAFVKHLYNIGLTSSTLVQHCTNFVLVGRPTSRHFSSASALLHVLVGRSAGRYFSSACLILHMAGMSVGLHFSQKPALRRHWAIIEPALS